MTFGRWLFDQPVRLLTHTTNTTDENVLKHPKWIQWFYFDRYWYEYVYRSSGERKPPTHHSEPKVLFQIKVCFWFISLAALLQHNDVMTWKHFPYYWPFSRGIQWRVRVNYHPQIGKPCQTLIFSLLSDCTHTFEWPLVVSAIALMRHHRSCEDNDLSLALSHRYVLENVNCPTMF